MTINQPEFDDRPNPCPCPPEVIELLDLAVRHTKATIGRWNPDFELGANSVKTFMEQPSEIWCRYISEKAV